MTDITPPKTWTGPVFSVPGHLLVHEQIPTLQRFISEKETAKESAVVACLAQFGMSMQDPEEIRRRCVIVHQRSSMVETLQIDGIPRLEWGYLDPKYPNTWTLRTVEPG